MTSIHCSLVTLDTTLLGPLYTLHGGLCTPLLRSNSLYTETSIDYTLEILYTTVLGPLHIETFLYCTLETLYSIVLEPLYTAA